MRTQYIYKTTSDDLIYVNNIGVHYLLTEAVSPLCVGSYDWIVAMKLNDKPWHEDEEDNFPMSYLDVYTDAKWFCGASFAEGKTEHEKEFFLETLKGSLDSKEEPKTEEKHPAADIIYTGGGIYCGILKVEDGWFMGEVNGWGTVYKTYEDAYSGDLDADSFVRNIEDLNEQIAIWVRIYTDAAVREENIDLCNQNMLCLVEDLTNC
jgi:hypothetical protein